MPEMEGLGRDLTVKCLLTEYAQMREEMRTFYRRLDSTYPLVSACVLGALAFAVKNNNMLMFCAAPVFFIAIISGFVSNWFAFNNLGLQMWSIENRLTNLNGGEPILTYESNARKVYGMPFLKACSGPHTVALMGPVHFSGIAPVLALLLPHGYAIYRATCALWSSWGWVWAVIYAIAVSLFSAALAFEFVQVARCTTLFNRDKTLVNDWSSLYRGWTICKRKDSNGKG